MISVSQAYKNLTKSNIRPKCEPFIKLSGKDEQGNEVNFVWSAKNLKDFSYKRGIDPIGRELPYMELTWTEIYSGKLDEELFPEKYNNIGKYMKVVLEFHQNLSFFNTWKTIFDKGLTWADLLGKTWKQVKNEVEKEVIIFPTLFLTAKPIYNKQTITWKAVDVLSLLQENQTKAFISDAKTKNIIKYFIINEIGNFRQSPDVADCLTQSKYNFDENLDIYDGNTIEKDIICDGITKDLIVKILQLRNVYIDFNNDGSFGMMSLGRSVENGLFTKNTLRAFPEVQKNPNISNYIFKSYTFTKNTDKTYTKTPVYYKTIKGYDVFKVDFDGYGTTDDGAGFLSLTQLSTLTTDPVHIIPVNWNSSDNIIVGAEKGEVLSEDISMNPYNSDDWYAQERFKYLKSYFDKSSTAKFSCLPDLSVTTGDIVQVETNLYKGAEATPKKCLVVKMELKYNGTVKQSFTTHEISWEV